MDETPEAFFSRAFQRLSAEDAEQVCLDAMISGTAWIREHADGRATRVPPQDIFKDEHEPGIYRVWLK